MSKILITRKFNQNREDERFVFSEIHTCEECNKKYVITDKTFWLLPGSIIKGNTEICGGCEKPQLIERVKLIKVPERKITI